MVAVPGVTGVTVNVADATPPVSIRVVAVAGVTIATLVFELAAESVSETAALTVTVCAPLEERLIVEGRTVNCPLDLLSICGGVAPPLLPEHPPNVRSVTAIAKASNHDR
jgi:hypothetical protein